MREKLLSLFLEKGSFIEPDAADYLMQFDDPLSRAEEIFSALDNLPLVLTLEDIREAQKIAERAATVAETDIEKHKEVPAKKKRPLGPRKEFPAKEYESDIKVIRDITGNSTCSGSIQDFSRYFKNRFHVLSSMLRSRMELRGAISTSRASKMTREVAFIGMISDVRHTRSGHLMLEIEDETGSVPVLVLRDGPYGKRLFLNDEVIGVIGSSGRNGYVLAERIFWPDIPNNKTFNASDVPVSVAFLADTHVGSKTFLKEKWKKFVEWMSNGDELARRVRYLVIPGDVVDGIGVYPGQADDLAVDDIYKQYEDVAGFIESLPDHLEVIILPGNHDAVRPAEPQPALPDKIKELFPSGVTFLGNPCVFSLHGVKVLAYHGRSIDDFVGAAPRISYETPLEAMKEMLRKRHLAPVYGGKTPIAPESEDYMIIDSIPDIFVTGHVHSVGVEDYRGVRIINASAWQSQTSYQRMHNFHPKPARVVVVNLEDGSYTIRQF